jgi:galactokinase
MAASARSSVNLGQTMQSVEALKSRFREIYGREPAVYRAPGRVNLIGEHTDYNDGLVLPAAIDLFTWVALAPRSDAHVRLRSEDLNEAAEFELGPDSQETTARWSRYVFGVALMLERDGQRLKGADLLIHGEVPMGAGVSSSAALEVAAGFALLANSGVAIEGRRLARLCQKAENEIVGTRCGIMDQLASACCIADHALLLDCRSLDFRNLPLPAGMRLVISNTMAKRELAATAYNTRRAECEEGVRILAQRFPHVRALRDVTLEQLGSCRSAMPENVFKRCRHVITEDERVLQAADALERNRLDDLQSAMAESHRSLRDDYEVSCAELDLLVDLANREHGVHGARMTGAGFGGCTISLVEADAVDAFRDRVSAEYERRTGIRPDIYCCRAADGAKSAD